VNGVAAGDAHGAQLVSGAAARTDKECHVV